ncbi:diadenosine tetraphosphate (Ap4A) HIT family hydrolase [Rhodopseudomonas julia]|uniref:Diadenosine tetraphosphate (Ap4A) HIT family hydrolase n=1 Tax=Rhodopseudomonas julia TaxID=200617 RepID=A0ABU0C4R6_9BRAD|nr:HIT family protein [Rhodopseudomonas julia]MDQ0325163.1 diadenosine tetraphosphate (Ap4A) HIT family hydrolase [Rhodopseudomonas julia]
MSGFSLHPRLAADTFPITAFPLCHVRLMNDATYPWLILVPARPELAEIIDLDAAQQNILTSEIDAAARALKQVTGCDKLNVAALGNEVRQLHIHVIARFVGDPAWPKPVWGAVPARPYAPDARDQIIRRLQDAFTAISA